MNRAIVIGLLVWSTTGITYAADRDDAGQAAAPDVSAQLLQEVRRLREAIETMVSTGARVQIVFGRLQLQEQRTETAFRRADTLRSAVAKAGADAARLAGKIREWEERLQDARVTSQDRAEMEMMLKHDKGELAEVEAERQRLVTEESLASAALADEQARWLALNQQLEELERLLTKKGG